MPLSGLQALRAPSTLVLCFSHLRWDLVVQRPHHLLRRAARSARVIYFEEAVRHDGPTGLVQRLDASGVTIVTPHLAHQTGDETATVRVLLNGLVAKLPHETLISWYYTPMALAYAGELEEDVCVYDCMDELSAFRFAPTALQALEAQLFERCDVVFTGGRSLYNAKRDRHENVHCLPSSIDVEHFGTARLPLNDPADQAAIRKPRVGFFGVIDERMDLDLVRETAGAMPETQFVMLGPVVKIDPASLPQGENLHWLGPKHYDELPGYLSNWQAGWMPFALNESTRYISPTKTPEFLAAGLPLASTAVLDVVESYGRAGLVEIAAGPAMVTALQRCLKGLSAKKRRKVDDTLSAMSWDRTWSVMDGAIKRLRGDVAVPGLTSIPMPRPGVVDHV